MKTTMTMGKIYKKKKIDEKEEEILTRMMMNTNDIELWMSLMEWVQNKMMECTMWNGEGEGRLKKNEGT